MFSLLPIVFLSLLTPLSTTLPLGYGDAVATIWTFPNATWIENIHVRQNGAVLCTSINRAAIYQVDPFSHVESTVHAFDSSDGVLGISEIANDVFVVVTATINLATSAAAPGSAKIWRVDMGAWEMGTSNAVTLISALPNVGLPDGVATLDYERGVVLLADAIKGLIWRVDTTTDAHTRAIQDPLFLPSNPNIPLGVDGIHILHNELYFTNLASNLFAKIPITANGSAAGPVQNITDKAIFNDDFALAADGTAYLAGDNTVWRVRPDGEAQILIGGPNDTAVQGITSAQFGRTRDDLDVLYMGTNGGLLFTPPGSPIRGGQLLAVNVGLFE